MIPTSRSVYRFSRTSFLAISAGLGSVLSVLLIPGSAQPQSGAARPLTARLVGTSSCAARGCHGSVDAVDPSRGDVYIEDGAFTTWRHFDPHARAFDVLKNDRSLKIARNLKIGAPSEARMCLACHSTVVSPELSGGGAIVSDGVACESCHGPAEKWQTSHLSPAWRKDFGARADEKMTDLSNASGRAQNCVGCHVGDRDRGMDVNHDLIAAGHPRLNFEYASFLASYPKHWRERHEKPRPDDPKPQTKDDFEIRSWAIGQLVTAKAVIKLTAARASMSIAEPTPGEKRVADAIWPEFAEYECFACHHSLTQKSPRQDPARFSKSAGPGQLPWATWSLALEPEMEKIVGLDPVQEPPTLPALQALMKKSVPDTTKTAEAAGSTIKQLDRWIDRLEQGPVKPEILKSLIETIPGRSLYPARGWDLAAQNYLARAVLARSGLPDADKSLIAPNGPYSTEKLGEILKLLQFPIGRDSWSEPPKP